MGIFKSHVRHRRSNWKGVVKILLNKSSLLILPQTGECRRRREGGIRKNINYLEIYPPHRYAVPPSGGGELYRMCDTAVAIGKTL